ncbi:hypothetical protein ABW21_db0203897 [Orbilia brochopaga]|nr:hypothetical protein ABW21_db0203897 [Drechslerella brochopaga]
MNTRKQTAIRKFNTEPRRRAAMNSNMLKVVLFSLLLLLATVLAAVAWYLTSTYRLPLPIPGLSIITTFFPVLDFIATAYTARQVLVPSKNGKEPIPYLLILINLVLFLVPAVLVTTSAPALFPANRCQLRQTWQSWFSAHDEDAIKGVQDALHCCGFALPVEMPFPFPRNAHKGKNDGIPNDLCARRLGGGDVTKFAFLMYALGNPEGVAFKPEVTEVYDGERGLPPNTRVIEENPDDSDEENEPPSDDDEEAAGRRGSRDNVTSRTALLMPSANGNGGMNGAGQHAYGATANDWS